MNTQTTKAPSKLLILTPMPNEHTILNALVKELCTELKLKEEDQNIHIIETGMGATNAAASLVSSLDLFDSNTVVLLTGFAGSMDSRIKKGEHVTVSRVRDWAQLPSETFFASQEAHIQGDLERIVTAVPAEKLRVFTSKNDSYFYDNDTKEFILGHDNFSPDSTSKANATSKPGTTNSMSVTSTKTTQAADSFAMVSFPCLLQGIETKNIYQKYNTSLVDMEAFTVCSFCKSLPKDKKPQSIQIIKTVTDALESSFKIEELGEYERLLSTNIYLTEAISAYLTARNS